MWTGAETGGYFPYPLTSVFPAPVNIDGMRVGCGQEPDAFSRESGPQSERQLGFRKDSRDSFVFSSKGKYHDS